MSAAILRMRIASIVLALVSVLALPCPADTPATTDSRDAALLARMTLAGEGQPAHAAQQGHDDRPRFGRPA